MTRWLLSVTKTGCPDFFCRQTDRRGNQIVERESILEVSLERRGLMLAKAVSTPDGKSAERVDESR